MTEHDNDDTGNTENEHTTRLAQAYLYIIYTEQEKALIYIRCSQGHKVQGQGLGWQGQCQGRGLQGQGVKILALRPRPRPNITFSFFVEQAIYLKLLPG